MKGHMQDGKFHPHTDYKKGVRKSRDQSVKTTGVKVERKAREVIFQDDPNAIPKLEQKLQDLEKQRAYWKTVKKTVPRDYSATEGDRKWFMPQNINANIRTVKKKLEVIKNRKEKNIGLERKTTFKNGRKVFYYEEVEPVGKTRYARDDHAKAKAYADDKLTGTMIHDLRLLQKLNAHDGSVADIDNLDDEQKEKLWKIMTRDEAFGVDHRNEKEMKDFYDNISNEWKDQYGIKDRKFNEETKSFDEFALPSKWNDLKDSNKGLLKLIVWRFNEPANSDNWHEIWKTGKSGKFIPNRDPIEVTI